jgi:hypothetical protein
MFVALNPGTLLADEAGLYQQKGIWPRQPGQASALGENDAAVILDFVLQEYKSRARSRNRVFHKKSAAYARALLTLLHGRDPGAQWLEHVWLTDALKCSTKRESGPSIPDAAFKNCETHLRAEIALVRPKAIIALGGRAFKRLKTAALGYPLVPFRHPSNGCPCLDARSHDKSFQVFRTVLSTLGIRCPDPASPAFREERMRIQQDIF